MPDRAEDEQDETPDFEPAVEAVRRVKLPPDGDGDYYVLEDQGGMVRALPYGSNGESMAEDLESLPVAKLGDLLVAAHALAEYYRADTEEDDQGRAWMQAPVVHEVGPQRVLASEMRRYEALGWVACEPPEPEAEVQGEGEGGPGSEDDTKVHEAVTAADLEKARGRDAVTITEGEAQRRRTAEWQRRTRRASAPGSSWSRT